MKAIPNEPHPIPIKEEDKTRTPWVEAIALMPKLKSEGIFNSSACTSIMSRLSLSFFQAWVITFAYDELQHGIEIMKSMRRIGEVVVGQTGVRHYVLCSST